MYPFPRLLFTLLPLNIFLKITNQIPPYLSVIGVRCLRAMVSTTAARWHLSRPWVVSPLLLPLPLCFSPIGALSVCFQFSSSTLRQILGLHFFAQKTEPESETGRGTGGPLLREDHLALHMFSISSFLAGSRPSFLFLEFSPVRKMVSIKETSFSIKKISRLRFGEEFPHFPL